MNGKCQNCGAIIDDDSRFCKYCGVKYEANNSAKLEISQKIEKTITHRFQLQKEKIDYAKIAKEKLRAEAEQERLKQLARIKEADVKIKEKQAESEKRTFMLFAGIFVLLLLLFLLGK